MKIGDRHAPGDRTRARRPARQRHRAGRDEPQRDERERRRDDDDDRDGSLRTGEDRQRRRASRRRAPRRRYSAGAAAPRGSRRDCGTIAKPGCRARARAARRRRSARSARRRARRARVRPGRSPARAATAATAANSAATAKGVAAPIASPAPTPISAAARNSISASATTAPPLAPSALRIARVARLRSTKPCAALATPTPPTTSEISPTSARNSPKRSRSREKSGETFDRVRVSQPASGNAAFASSTNASTTGLARRRAAGVSSTRVVQRISEPGWTRPLARSASCEISTRGPRPMPVASRSGSETSSARISKCAAPSSNVSPTLRPSRSSSAGSTAAPKRSLPLRERRARRHRGLENRRAEPRPGLVDRLDFDERRVARGVARHRAHRGDGRELAAALQERALLGGKLAMDQRKRGVAAENRPAVARQSVVRARARAN